MTVWKPGLWGATAGRNMSGRDDKKEVDSKGVHAMARGGITRGKAVSGCARRTRAQVRVVPEFDTPGHTFPSWGKGGPSDLLTTCNQPATHNTGPLRVDREQTYSFLDTLLREVAQAAGPA